MSKQRFMLSVLLVVALLVPGVILAQPAAPQVTPVPEPPASSTLFIENAGQWPDAARFQVWGSPAGVGTTWMAEDAIWITIIDAPFPARDPRHDILPSPLSFEERGEGPGERGEVHGLNLKLSFPGSNPKVQIQPLNPLTTTVNYFLGNDSTQWHPAVPVYGGVRYVDLYPGVDLVLGEADSYWRLEARPNAATGQVHVQVEGACVEAVDDGMLRLAADGERLSLALPQALFAYRVSGVSRQGEPLNLAALPSVRAPIPTQSDDNPQDLLYGTFLGGMVEDDWGAKDIAVDAVGSAYVTGTTPMNGFSTTPGAFDPSYNGGDDAFVVKLNPAGSGLAYATFLGGTGADEGYAIAVDGAGSAYVTGETASHDFPTTPDAFDPNFNGGDYHAFVVKLNPAGSGLAYATYLSGSATEVGHGIAVDAVGNAYVTGWTYSGDFPTTPGAFDRSSNGGEDAFVAKLNPAGSELAYGTFLGGSSHDVGSAITVDGVGSAYVTGSTESNDFPTMPGAFDTSYNGGLWDAFVIKLNPAASGLAYATYLGGSEWDDSHAIALDRVGSVYVTGSTRSSDFPVSSTAFDPSYNGGYSDAFVVKLNAAASGLAYGTFLGSSRGDTGSAIAVDGASNAYVTGAALFSEFPTTPGAFDTSFNGLSDVFVAKLNATGNGLSYGTFLGGNHEDFGYGIAVDETGSVYVAGLTGSREFPTTPGAFDTSFNGGNHGDAFVVKLNTYVPQVVAPIEQPHAGSFVSGTVTIGGFAIDLATTTGTGIDRVQLYLDGPYTTGTSLGQATYGLARPDIAAQHGAGFGPSGWELVWDTTGLAPGVHGIYLYAHHTTDSNWSQNPPHLVIVRAAHMRWLPLMTKQ